MSGLLGRLLDRAERREVALNPRLPDPFAASLDAGELDNADPFTAHETERTVPQGPIVGHDSTDTVAPPVHASAESPDPDVLPPTAPSPAAPAPDRIAFDPLEQAETGAARPYPIRDSVVPVPDARPDAASPPGNSLPASPPSAAPREPAGQALAPSRVSVEIRHVAGPSPHQGEQTAARQPQQSAPHQMPPSARPAEQRPVPEPQAILPTPPPRRDLPAAPQHRDVPKGTLWPERAPSVEIHIDRVEIVAAPVPRPQPSARRKNPPKPELSLEAYLAEKGAGK